MNIVKCTLNLQILQKKKDTMIAKRLRAIASAEKHHKERYEKLLELVESNKIYKKDKEVIWTCRKCGYTHKGKKPLEKCPSCDHPVRYFQIKCEKY